MNPDGPLDPGDSLDEDLYELPPERLASIATVPSSLEASLDALEADHAYLLEGDVFTPGLIEAYLRYKREEEVDAIRMRPHPLEFALYRDVLKVREYFLFDPEEDYVPVDNFVQTRNDPWTLWTHVWSPKEPGRYSIRLVVKDPAVRTRRLESGYYVRSVEISEV